MGACASHTKEPEIYVPREVPAQEVVPLVVRSTPLRTMNIVLPSHAQLAVPPPTSVLRYQHNVETPAFIAQQYRDTAGGPSGGASMEGQPNLHRPASLPIADSFQTWAELQQALQKVESSTLIIGIDHTKSNSWNGYDNQKNLHAIGGALNPYQQVLTMLYQSLVQRMDDDHQIPVYGFGCSDTTNRQVFSYASYKPCHTLEEILYRYKVAAQALKMSGPTNFAPLVYEAIDVVKEAGKYHILIIICDGAVDKEVDIVATRSAVLAAREYPLSIVCIGVGKGPFDEMKRLDDGLAGEPDNFQFLHYTQGMSDDDFKLHALMEVPEQYEYFSTRADGRRTEFPPEVAYHAYRCNKFRIPGPDEKVENPYKPPPAQPGVA
jgi:E3 ubiquitin-protein ligase RGLG